MNVKWKKLIEYYKPYRKLFVVDMFFAILGALITLIIPIIVKCIMDFVVYYERKEFFNAIIWLAILMFLLVLIQYYCNYFTEYYGHFLGARIERDMRNEIFKHYQLLPIKYYNNQKTGKVMSRIMSDLNGIANALHHIPAETFVSGLTILGAFFILVRINFILALIAIAVLPFLTLYLKISIIKMKKTFEATHEKISNVNSQIEDSLAGIRVVKSFVNENIEIEKFKKANDMFLESRRQNLYQRGLFYSGSLSFIFCLLPLIAICGAIFIYNKAISVSDLALFIMYVNTFATPVYKILSMAENFEDNLAGYERFLEILKIDTENYGSENKIKKEILGKIEFNNVAFKYSSKSKNIFTNFNLSIKYGEYIALVGHSGVGKTTLCNLIPRFYEPCSGRIAIDDLDIKKYPLTYLRNNIGIVQQELYLFDDTIKANIRYGCPNASDEEIIESAKKANIHNFIMSLPNQYGTFVGQKGIKLSGGQKQRISIARVFLKNPPILIFDEATSALDNKSEKYIQKSLALLSENRTTIVIAHRLSTIIKANRILVITEGGISEEGTHEELINRDGIYNELYNFQLI